MFFQESEAIARDHPDLRQVIDQVDQRLFDVRTPAPLRPTDFSCALGAENNQVVSVFQLLATHGFLVAVKMVECEQCQNLMPAESFQQAIEDEDKLECTGCGSVFSRNTRPRVVYQMTPSAFSRSKSQSLPQKTKADLVLIAQKRPWPDPEKHTTAKVWSVKGGAFRMSTKTNGNDDGTVEFAPTDSGKHTVQMRFMQLLCFKFPTPITLAEIIQQVYSADLALMGRAGELMKTLRKLRTLVSDIRTKKLAKANLNPEILPSLNIDATKDTGIVLRLAHLHRMDDKNLDDADQPHAHLRSNVTS